jgi:hypothetical protein
MCEFIGTFEKPLFLTTPIPSSTTGGYFKEGFSKVFYI